MAVKAVPVVPVPPFHTSCQSNRCVVKSIARLLMSSFMPWKAQSRV